MAVTYLFQMTKPRIASLSLLGLCAILGIFLILYATPQGLGLSDDSIAYIAGARSILSGQGYREAWLASNGPVTHFPPAFPSVLAFVGLSGLDPIRGARFVNALLFGANTFLLGLIGWRMTKSQVAGIILALLFVVNASLFRVHAVAMSEPLYIFFSLISFLLFEYYIDKQRMRWLVLTGCFAGLAYLTRYAGLALFATFLVAVFLLRNTWRLRVTRSLVFVASFLPWAVAWAVRNKLVADNATNRTLVYHPLSSENIKIGIYNFSEFLIPVETWRRALVKTPDLFFAFIAMIALSLLVWVLYKGLKRFLNPKTELPEVLSFTNGLYIFGYLASIVSSMMLFDASTKFKLRINSPVYVSLLILLVWLGFWLWSKRSMMWRGLVGIFTVSLLLLSVKETVGVITQLHKGGQGYASFQWYDSDAMKFLSKLPEGTRIYTNQPGPVYLYTGRPSYVLPDLIDPVTGLPREGFEEGVKGVQHEVLSGNAVLALFKFGSEAEDVQSTYLQLADGLYLGHDSHGDKIYTSNPK
ncbi:MAG: phospholipid carrier-dependent glycosyltransferase [Anaerolineales bacterium]